MIFGLGSGYPFFQSWRRWLQPKALKGGSFHQGLRFGAPPQAWWGKWSWAEFIIFWHSEPHTITWDYVVYDECKLRMHCFTFMLVQHLAPKKVSKIWRYFPTGSCQVAPCWSPRFHHGQDGESMCCSAPPRSQDLSSGPSRTWAGRGSFWNVRSWKTFPAVDS